MSTPHEFAPREWHTTPRRGTCLQCGRGCRGIAYKTVDDGRAVVGYCNDCLDVWRSAKQDREPADFTLAREQREARERNASA